MAFLTSCVFIAPPPPLIYTCWSLSVSSPHPPYPKPKFFHVQFTDMGRLNKSEGVANSESERASKRAREREMWGEKNIISVVA